MKRILSPRVALVVIAGMFVFPLILAWLMYSGVIEFNPVNTRNLGTLVRPAVPVPLESLRPAEPQSAPMEELAGHWVVLYPLPHPCDTSCLDDVAALRQVHRASGKNLARIRLLLVGAEPGHRFLDVYPSFYLAAAGGAEFESRINSVAEKFAAQAEGSLYLVDPLGNIMLFYAAGFDANDLKKDLKRLLTWSKLDE